MAFSRDAGFQSYHMSDVLKGTYSLSYKRANDVAVKLKMKNTQRERFVFLVTAAHAKNKEDRDFAVAQLKKYSYKPDRILDIKEFDLISAWYHLAILELARREDFLPEAEFIASKLSITKTQAQISLSRLQSLGLINLENPDKVNEKKMVYLLNQSSSQSVRSYHKQSLKKASAAIEELESSKRYAFTQNYSLTEDEYNEVTKKIHDTVTEFFLEIQNNQEKGDEKTLYCFSSCLFPLEKKSN
jgi:uncharacterized protein (TIGR02147 family)